MQVISCRCSQRDGRILAHRFGCNKEGYCVSIRGNFGSVRKSKASTREGCKAMIHIKYDKSGKWVITKFVKDQNHPLVASPREARQTMEAYVVNNEEGKNSPSSVMPRDKYPNPLIFPLIFHDGRLTFLPTPSATLYMFRKLVAHADQQKQEKEERDERFMLQKAKELDAFDQQNHGVVPQGMPSGTPEVFVKVDAPSTSTIY